MLTGVNALQQNFVRMICTGKPIKYDIFVYVFVSQWILLNCVTYFFVKLFIKFYYDHYFRTTIEMNFKT